MQKRKGFPDAKVRFFELKNQGFLNLLPHSIVIFETKYWVCIRRLGSTMLTSKQIRQWRDAKKKTVVKLEKNMKAANARIKKLEEELRKAVETAKSATAKRKKT